MATVRIYKVAELLGLSSQEAMDLLQKETGIGVKSASSSIEEIVARQFVERHARKRQIALPHGPLFADTPAAKRPALKGGKAPEPPKPVAPVLRPRLVKAIRPAAAADVHADAGVVEHVEDVRLHEPVARADCRSGRRGGAGAGRSRIRSATIETAAVEHAPVEVAAAPPSGAGPGGGARRGGRRFGRRSSRRRAAIRRPLRRSAHLDVWSRRLAGCASKIRSPAKRPAARPVAAATGHPAPAGAAGADASGGRCRRPERSVPPPCGPVRPRCGRRSGGRVRCRRNRSVRPRRERRRVRQGCRIVQARRVRRSAATGRDRRAATIGRRRPCSFEAPPPPITKMITLAEGMSVKDLADKLEVKAKDVLKKLMDRRMMLTINSTLDSDTAQLIARDFGAEVLMRSFEEELTEVETETSKPEDLVTRAPVVTVMGHVDHGKTTLLDAIRETKVAEREAGGITQHIGAYSVDVGGRRVVFLDTPGHEAFTMMRARGARVTDIVVLVVAADDGVMPQTKEAIDHAKAANVPIVVAINKIDKADANPERVKRELSDLGLMPEEWGGTTVTVEVSARQRKNLDQLLEMLLLVADLADLKANPKRRAHGTVLEAKLDRGRGPVATVLVQDGTLSEGDLFIAGTVDGKVRALFDHLGRKSKRAGPATPAEVLGLSSLPQPGDTFQVIDDPIKARQVVAYRQAQAKERALGAKGGRLTLESLQQQMAEGGMKELPLIIKADVQGSSEVLADTLAKLSDDRVKIRIIHTGVGAINESDVLLATASNAIIIGFNVRPDRNAADIADREKVDIRQHSVIYNVTDEMKKAMAGLLEPTLKETRIGAAEVRQTFRTPKVGTVAGCMVTEGRITRSGDTQARLLRDNIVVWTGKLGSLRRFKDDVSEVKVGTECGIVLDRFNDVKERDIIEVFQVEKIAQAL